MKRYVIVGGSIAGVSCVEGIRSRDPEGQITVLSAEPVSTAGPSSPTTWRGRRIWSA